ncbi:hypothetical protein RUM44_003542 [Polyplax serrata]|uniref:Uncharacterized protein n=1 Tax=Polyplax serrata TaxID=468196 RepID=A0ABR1AGR8_POLSC
MDVCSRASKFYLVPEGVQNFVEAQARKGLEVPVDHPAERQMVVAGQSLPGASRTHKIHVLSRLSSFAW